MSDAIKLEAVLQLSTAHLRTSTREILENAGKDISSGGPFGGTLFWTYGWLVYTHTDFESADADPSGHEWSDMRACCALAKAHRAGWIRFDVDGPIVDGLVNYDADGMCPICEQIDAGHTCCPPEPEPAPDRGPGGVLAEATITDRDGERWHVTVYDHAPDAHDRGWWITPGDTADEILVSIFEGFRDENGRIDPVEIGWESSRDVARSAPDGTTSVTIDIEPAQDPADELRALRIAHGLDPNTGNPKGGA